MTLKYERLMTNIMGLIPSAYAKTANVHFSVFQLQKAVHEILIIVLVQ